LNSNEINNLIEAHLQKTYSAQDVRDLSNTFARFGFIKVPKIVPPEIYKAVDASVRELLKQNAERRDLLLATTGNTPRKMSVVKSEIIGQDAYIPPVSKSKALLKFLGQIANEELVTSVSSDEEYLITHQQKVGDTHGWHWGDYSFALIWIIDTPPVEYGGMLQCVPHTRWNKVDPRINELLSSNPIDTYSFVPGDIYLLRTDTTLHRTVPLERDANRIIVNMTWASRQDREKQLVGDDRWWDNPVASAANHLETALAK